MCEACDRVRIHCQAAVEEGKSHSLATAVMYLLNNYFSKTLDEAAEEAPPGVPDDLIDHVGTSMAFNQLVQVALIGSVRAQEMNGEEARRATLGAVLGNFTLAAAVAEATITGTDIVEWVEEEIVKRVRNMRDDPDDTTLADAEEWAANIRAEEQGRMLDNGDPVVITAEDAIQRLQELLDTNPADEVDKLLADLGMSTDDAEEA